MTKKILLYFLLAVTAFLFLYPFYWMLMASLSPEKTISDLSLLPVSVTLENYIQMISKIPIWRSLFNSLFVSVSITTGVLVFGSMVGYALAVMKFRGREFIFYVIIFTMTLPFQITIIPQYIVMVKLGWIDHYAALIVPYLMNSFAVIMFRQHFKTIPLDLIDAARIDGCGELRIIFRVLWPNSIPALVTIGIVTFMSTWNEVLWPLIVIRDHDLMTMPQLVTLFVVGGSAESQLGVKLAAATSLALPIVIAYTFFQKYFIQSMATSGTKD